MKNFILSLALLSLDLLVLSQNAFAWDRDREHRWRSHDVYHPWVYNRTYWYIREEILKILEKLGCDNDGL